MKNAALKQLMNYVLFPATVMFGASCGPTSRATYGHFFKDKQPDGTVLLKTPQSLGNNKYVVEQTQSDSTIEKKPVSFSNSKPYLSDTLDNGAVQYTPSLSVFSRNKKTFAKETLPDGKVVVTPVKVDKKIDSTKSKKFVDIFQGSISVSRNSIHANMYNMMRENTVAAAFTYAGEGNKKGYTGVIARVHANFGENQGHYAHIPQENWVVDPHAQGPRQINGGFEFGVTGHYPLVKAKWFGLYLDAMGTFGGTWGQKSTNHHPKISMSRGGDIKSAASLALAADFGKNVSAFAGVTEAALLDEEGHLRMVSAGLTFKMAKKKTHTVHPTMTTLTLGGK